MLAESRQIAGIPLELKWSKRRKTIGLKVQDGRVSVSAPMRTIHRDIEAFVASKADWVRLHLDKQAREKTVAPTYAEGSHLSFLGDPLTLTYHALENIDGNKYAKKAGAPKVCRHEHVLCLSLLENALDNALDNVKKAILAWYAVQAKVYLAERVAYYAPLMQAHPKGLKVRVYKSRWGSCDRHGNLQFNTLIMLAPRDVVDYVVVHELAHLHIFDHSPAFWRLVENVLPAYRDAKSYLRQHGNQLVL